MSMVFGWAASGLLLSRILNISRSRSENSSLWTAVLSGVVGLCFLLTAGGESSIVVKFIGLVASVLLLVVVSNRENRSDADALLYLANGSYIGVGFYFLMMHQFPSSFPNFWLTISPSASDALDMLLVCFFFQNLGSYVVWALLGPWAQSIRKWASSNRNLVNLSFIRKPQHQLILFATLSVFGLISRLWNFSLGNFYYTSASGIPASVSSFLAQFDRLYVISWLYGYSLLLQTNFRANKSVRYLTGFLIVLEFVYQLFSGSKGRFFAFVVVPLASVFMLIKKRLSWYPVLCLGGIGLTSWLLLYPILVTYRSLLASAIIGGGTAPLDTFIRSWEVLRVISVDQYTDIILRPFTSSGIAEQVIAMTSIVHHQVSQDGNFILPRLLLFWIPRAIWPSKPSALSANLVGRSSGRLPDHDLVTSVVITGPGELYLYYGLLGGSLMILAGLLFRWMNESISPFKNPSPFRIAVLIAFLPQIGGVLSSSFEASITGIVLQLGVLYAVLFLVKAIVSPS